MPWLLLLVASGIYILAVPLFFGSFGHPLFAIIVGLLVLAYASEQKFPVPPWPQLADALDAAGINPPRQDSLKFLDAANAMRDVPHGLRPSTLRKAVRVARENFEKAVASRANAIQVVPAKDGSFRLTQQVDGVNKKPIKLSRNHGVAFILGAKLLGGMNVSGKHPQTVDFRLAFQGRILRVCVSTESTALGERFDARFRDCEPANGKFREGFMALGLPSTVGDVLQTVVQRGRGMLVICGPKGSGRTTTAYAAMHEIGLLQHKIHSIEDDLACDLLYVSQQKVDPTSNRTTTQLLGNLLSDSKGIIVVDGIHDLGAACSALQAATTRAVVATLQAEDAADALMHFLRLGVPPGLLQSAVTAVVAQRLVRVLCEQCKIRRPPPAVFLRKLRNSSGVTAVFRRGNCRACARTGYRSRTPVHELLLLDSDVRDALQSNPSRRRIRKLARNSGMHTLRESSLELIRHGITSIHEVVRVVP